MIYTTIGVSESTLYRELKRNSKPRGVYDAKYAQMLADERCKEDHIKKYFTKLMQLYIEEKLTKHQWFPMSAFVSLFGRTRLIMVICTSILEQSRRSTENGVAANYQEDTLTSAYRTTTPQNC